MKSNILILFIVIGILGSCGERDVKEIDLSGQWRFKIDSLDQGVPFELVMVGSHVAFERHNSR